MARTAAWRRSRGRASWPRTASRSFSFLAFTPEQEGEIVWKSIQTYDDGSPRRAGSASRTADNPAAVTTISKDAPARERGRRERDAEDGAAATPAASATAAPEDAEPRRPRSRSHDSPLPIIISIVALVLAAAALILQLRRRTP